MFVTFEGIDGAGKTTLLRGMAEALGTARVDVVVTKEPGGTPLADAIRAVFKASHDETFHPETEALLVCAARCQHVREVVRPALARGATVLCDRFADSTFAYQGARGIDPDDLDRLNRFATGGLEPDLTFLVDLSPEDALLRVGDRARLDRLEADRGYQDRIRQSFLRLAERHPGRILVLDGRLAPERLLADALAVLEARTP